MSGEKARIGMFRASSKGPVRVYFSKHYEFTSEEGAENMTLEQAFVFLRAVQLKMIGGDGYDLEGDGAEYRVDRVELYGLTVEPSRILSLYKSKRRNA